MMFLRVPVSSLMAWLRSSALKTRAATVAAFAILSAVIVSGSTVDASCSDASAVADAVMSAVDAVIPTKDDNALRRETFAMADSTLWFRGCASHQVGTLPHADFDVCVQKP
jgi:hypothetical protein